MSGIEMLVCFKNKDGRRKKWGNVVASGDMKKVKVNLVARMGEDRGVHRLLVGKPEGNKPLGRPRRRWEDNIKIDIQEVGGVVGTGWSWLRIGTGGGHLWVQ